MALASLGSTGKSGLVKKWREQTGGRERRTNGKQRRGQSYEGNGSGVWIGIVSMTEDDQLVVLENGEPWLLLAVALSHFYPLHVLVI